MSVLKLERREKIINYVHEKRTVAVVELCSLFNVSEATVRRDITELAAENLLKRTHGSVSVPDSAKLEAPVISRQYINKEEKRLIGQAAAKLINDKETVFLGSGSTVIEIAKNLRSKKSLTVITNSLPIINLLANESDINIVVTGGYLRQPELSLIGHIVEHSLSELRADKVLLGIQGIHLQQGLTNTNLPETMTDRTLFSFSSKVIVVADHTKFDVVNASFVVDFSNIDTIITDAGTSSEFLDELERKGIKVIIASQDRQDCTGEPAALI